MFKTRKPHPPRKQEWLKWCFAMICGCVFLFLENCLLFLGYFLTGLTTFLFMFLAFAPFADIITDYDGKILPCWKFLQMVYIPQSFSHIRTFKLRFVFVQFTPICNCLLLYICNDRFSCKKWVWLHRFLVFQFGGKIFCCLKTLSIIYNNNH